VRACRALRHPAVSTFVHPPDSSENAFGSATFLVFHVFSEWCIKTQVHEKYISTCTNIQHVQICVKKKGLAELANSTRPWSAPQEVRAVVDPHGESRTRTRTVPKSVALTCVRACRALRHPAVSTFVHPPDSSENAFGSASFLVFHVFSEWCIKTHISTYTNIQHIQLCVAALLRDSLFCLLVSPVVIRRRTLCCQLACDTQECASRLLSVAVCIPAERSGSGCSENSNCCVLRCAGFFSRVHVA
jgi:hypothetical protein